VRAVKLVIEPETRAVASARGIIEQAREQIADEVIQRNFIDLIETIVVYKLPQKSRQEIEQMLGLGDLKQTKFYQEAFEEGEEVGEQKARLEAIPAFLKEGVSVEQIARALKLPLEVVQKVADQESSGD
jgi:predicted transposase/invertase (TIGR01784 family)